MNPRSCLAFVYGAALLLAGCGGSRDVTVQPPAIERLNVQRVFTGLPAFSSPVALLQAPGDPSRWFVVEQVGRVFYFDNHSAVSTRTAFIDISARVASGGEMGLLGMAFHPGFPSNPHVYLYYTNTSSGRVSRVSSFTTPNGGMSLDPNSEQILLTVSQPEDNHKGGNLAFGPDSYLYIGLGDGGGGNDQHGSIGNGQLLTTLLGKMLRINVDATTGSFRYGIPADNPYSGNALCGTNGTGTQNCPEIYAYGFRNPWRWSFDRQTGQLWVADVGQSATEEVDRVTLGGNYGWRCFEGSGSTGMSCGSPQNPLPPVAQYGHGLGNAITGGYVYRGTAISGLAGQYVFGDFGSGRIWAIAASTAPTLTVTDGFQSGLSIASFAQGTDGELYIVHYGGQLYRLGGS